MDLRRLELLMQVAAFDSFSKAATVLGIAQPALGRQIQKLEEECGVRLFYRHGRGVSLTPEGETLLHRARPLVRQLAAIPADLQSERDSPCGLVTVGLTPTVCNLFGLKLITATRDKYPQLRVNVVSGYSGYVHEWLVDGRLDMAVLHDARRSSTVAVDPLAAAELFFIMPSADTAFDLPAEATLSALSEVPLVLPTRNHGLRRTLEYAASDAGIGLNVQYEVDTLELLKQIVVSGLACTVLAKPAVLKELAAGTLIAHRIASPDLQTKLMLATAVRRPITRGIRLVEQEIKSLVTELVANKADGFGLVALEP
ncbi:bacterial regulatory helix-turn-helix, lysR family protein [Paraburkholderia fungorum]|uniref:Bacterial regulatory helix-turn-helix, lysR family protein n=1 Tax=Paraburkholderia fungorum TaxID=134537 RepID=A0AAU8SVQ5_9BURK|nr:LysR family transcriptional regulator [Paraburkholderia fungorum]AJZ57079.1 bacterial regulatory helix-turn-helix, lysR family protein [Paraburkholderia fungorum]